MEGLRPEAAKAVAEAALVLAREAAEVVRLLQEGQTRPNPAAQRACVQAGEALQKLEMICQGRACPSGSFQAVAWALQTASVAITEAKVELTASCEKQAP